MPVDGTKVTRLGLYGGPRSPQTFSAKTPFVPSLQPSLIQVVAESRSCPSVASEAIAKPSVLSESISRSTVGSESVITDGGI